MNRIKTVIAAIIISITIISGSQAQADERKPLLLLFTSVMVREKKQEAKKKPSKKKKEASTVNSGAPEADNKPLLMMCDPRIVTEVVAQIQATGKMDVLVFNPDYAGIKRAVLDKRIKQAVVDNPAEATNAYQIAKAISADYALRIQGSVDAVRVDIALEIINVRSQTKWASSAGADVSDESGPRAEAARKNAVFNAASTAVSQIMILALGQKEMMKREPAPVQTETPPAATQRQPRDLTAEVAKYVKQADVYVSGKDLPSAVQELRRAINIQPTNIDLRLRLADLYLQMKQADDSLNEYKRAILFSRNDEKLYSRLVSLYMSAGKFDEAGEYLTEIIRIDPNNVDARLNLGDLFWNQSKIDDAEKSYLDALRIAPNSSSVQEKLYKLYYARKQFDKAFGHLIQSKQLASADSSENGRYAVISQVMQDEFNSIQNRINTGRTEFDMQVISREDYYQECKASAAEVDAFSDRLFKEKAPSKYESAHPHALLAINLLSQVCGSMVSYFETEKRHYLDQAGVFQTEAQNEMGLYLKALGTL